MRKLVVAAFATLTWVGLAASPSFATDAPRGNVFKSPVYTQTYYRPIIWTGFYIGVNGGYGFDGMAKQVDSYSGGFSVTNEIGGASGGIFGGQAGFNWQVTRHVLLGLETDFQKSWMKTSRTQYLCQGCMFPYSLTDQASLDMFGTTVGRLGFVYDRLLVAAIGGVAYGKVTVTQTYADVFGNISFTSGMFGVGYTIGAVGEYLLTDNLSAKIQYNYLELALMRNGSSYGYTGTTDYNAHIVRAGLNWRFPIH